MSYYKLTNGTDGEIAVARAEKDIQGRDIPTTYLTSATLSDYATEAWVNSKGYLTSSALSGYATETWVTNQGYITSSALSGYATETWVTNRGYITSSALNNYATISYADSKLATKQSDLGLVLTEVA